MKLSYLVTCHNEDRCLDSLLSKLTEFLDESSEIVVVDDYSTSEQTLSILEKYKDTIHLYQRHLENNYGAQKNYGIEQCKGDWIFQIDADEKPTDMILENIYSILEANEENEVIWIPRMNIFNGVTESDIKQWGWKYHDGLINFPDYQSRLFLNRSHIRYQRRLHEKVEGFKSYTFIPPQKDIALIHEKSIEKQRKTNLKYNEKFTQKENQGYQVK